MARLIVLCGLPGSGKTTTAVRLIAEYGGVRMCPDEWMRALEVDLWDEAFRARIEALQWTFAQALLQAGTDVTLEWGTWARDERDVLREWCHALDAEVSLVYLDVDRAELARRLAARNADPEETAIPVEMIHEWSTTVFQPPTPDELLLFDPLPWPQFTSRRGRPADVAFLWDMLYESIHVRTDQTRPPRSVLDAPDFAHYLVEFGTRPGDDSQVVIDRLGRPVAAAFCRCLPADDPGYAHVADDIPEFGLAVERDQRRKGLGRRVLTDLLARHPRMSLSVDRDNQDARALYDSLGFVEVGDDGNSTTMLRSVQEP